MISNEIETSFEDGEWITKARAAVIFEVSERTIENRIKGGSLSSKVEEGKTLVFVKSSKLSPMGGESFPNNTKPFATIPQRVETSSKPCEECEALRSQIETLRNALSNEREAHAKLQGIMEGKDKLIAEKDKRIEEITKAKDETIAKADQAINAANAAVLIYEQHKTAPAIEAKQESQEEAKPLVQVSKHPAWMFWMK